MPPGGYRKSCVEGLPVRVVRGAGGDPKYSPAVGFRYDGLFRVEDFWSKLGKSGHLVWRYRLEQLSEETEPEPPALPPGTQRPGRVHTTIQRVVRSTDVIQAVKTMHGHRCQVCGEALLTPAGEYAEGAHIRPLGRPHNGPDVPSNVLCLCPNHHVLFDRGGISVSGDLRVLKAGNGRDIGRLRTVAGHALDRDALAHHRERFGSGSRPGAGAGSGRR